MSCPLVVTPLGENERIIMSDEVVWGKATTGGTSLNVSSPAGKYTMPITETVAELVVQAPTAFISVTLPSDAYAVNVKYIAEVLPKKNDVTCTIKLVNPYNKLEATNTYENIKVKLEAACIAGGSAGLEVFTQQISGQADENIVVTANGGVLPTDDKNISLFGPTGALFQGAGAGEYTINRATTPNRLILNTVPSVPLNFYLLIHIPD
jgi:hypothetical protein